MLLRRHRETPEIDPAFEVKPADTLDPAFRAGPDLTVGVDPEATPAEPEPAAEQAEVEAPAEPEPAAKPAKRK